MELTRIIIVLVSQVLCVAGFLPPIDIDLPTDEILPPIDFYTTPVPTSLWQPVIIQGGCDINCTIRGNLPCVVERIQEGECPTPLTNPGIDFPSNPEDFRAVLNFRESSGIMEPYLDILWKPPGNALTNLKGYQMSLFRMYNTFKKLECVRFNMTNAVWTDDDFDNRQQLQHNYSCYGPLIEDKSSSPRSYYLQVDLTSLPQPRLTQNTQENIITWVMFVPPPVSVTDFTPKSAYLWKASPLVMFSEATLELRVIFHVAPAQFNIQQYTLAVHDHRTSNVIPSTMVDVDGYGKKTIQRTFLNLCNGSYYVTVEPKAWDGDTCLCPNNDGGCKCSVARAPFKEVQTIFVDKFIPDQTCNGPVTTSSTTKRSEPSTTSSTTSTTTPASSIEESISTPSGETSVTSGILNTEPLKVGRSTEEEPNGLGGGQIAGIVVGVCLGVSAALVAVFIFKRRRQHEEHLKSLLPMIVIVASMDNESHLRLVIALASFISLSFKCRVVCNLQEQITDSILDKADYIIVVASEGAFHRYNASKEGKEYKLVKTKQPISDSLIPLLQSLKRNLISYPKFAEKVVKVKFPYSADQCLQNEYDNTLKLTLMDDLGKLLSSIPAEQNEQNGDDQQINESYSNLINAKKNARDFHRKDPAWFTEKFYITREGVYIPIESPIAPEMVDLDIGAGGNRSDVLSIVSGNTECVTVSHVNV